MGAGVYANRLRMGMALQADTTVIYPVTKGKPLGRRIRQPELKADNGYNTYARAGLPQGTMANHRRESIDAVLDKEPTKTNNYGQADLGGLLHAAHMAATTHERQQR